MLFQGMLLFLGYSLARAVGQHTPKKIEEECGTPKKAHQFLRSPVMSRYELHLPCYYSLVPWHTSRLVACKLLQKENHLRFCQEQRLLGMQRASTS